MKKTLFIVTVPVVLIALLYGIGRICIYIFPQLNVKMFAETVLLGIIALVPIIIIVLLVAGLSAIYDLLFE
jgi:hypothetical protein